VFDRDALGVENGLLGFDNDVGFHVREVFTMNTPACPLWPRVLGLIIGVRRA
jgi:hypothetical protein